MKFRKFESIENTYLNKNIQKIVFNGYDKGEWIVTEKLHGCNFSVYIKDLEVINFGSRNQFIDESFLNSGELQNEIKSNINKKVFDIEEEEEECYFYSYKNSEKITVLKYFKDLNIDIFKAEIIIYGELVGDRIQKGIRYTKDIGFFVFDIVVNGKPMNKKISREFASILELTNVPVKFIGNFKECCEKKNTFNSHLSYNINNDYFSLCMTDKGFRMYDTETGKLLEDTTDGYCNEAEGIIIEPVEPMYFENGKRIILKNKTKKFSEKNTGIINIETNELNEKDKCLLELLLIYLNENRLNNVKSKDIQKEKLPYILVKDIIEEYNKENDVSLKEESENYKIINKLLQVEVKKFIGE